MTYFAVVAAILCVVRLVWIGDYLRRCHTAASGRGVARWTSAYRTATRLTTSKLGGDPDQRRHDLAIGLSERQLDTSLVGGSVALAGWTQLFVSSGGGPGGQISAVSLDLLFAGALVLVSAPILFRVAGSHLTYLGRETGSFVGFGLVLLSLLSIVADLVPNGVVRILAMTAAGGLAVRDAVEVRLHLRLHRAFDFGG